MKIIRIFLLIMMFVATSCVSTEKNEELTASELYEKGKIFWNENRTTKAVECWQQAAKMGHAEAQASLGSCYFSGEGVDENWDLALAWYFMAAAQDNISAIRGIAIYYIHTENTDETIRWYERAAELDDVESQYDVAFRYNSINDTENAKKWYKKAAENGHKRAQKALSELN